MTRLGMKEGEMGEMAILMSDALKGRTVIEEVKNLRSRFTEVQYA